MSMQDPLHPVGFIREVSLAPFQLSSRKAAAKLQAVSSPIQRLTNGESIVTPAMTLLLLSAAAVLHVGRCSGTGLGVG